MSGLLEFLGSGSSAAISCQMTTQRPARYVWLTAPPTPAPTSTCLRDTRGLGFGPKDHLKNRDTKWKARVCQQHPPLPAHAQSRRHMACARVKLSGSPRGPCPPSHAKAEPSALRQHSVTNRNANSGVQGSMGFGFCSSLFSTGNLGGGAAWFVIFCQNYNKTVISVAKV